MVRVILCDNTEKVFKTKEVALRFMYAMKGKGINIDCYMCDDPYDNEWLNRRIRF